MKEYMVVYLDKHDYKITTFIFAESKSDAMKIVRKQKDVYRVLYVEKR